MALTYTEFDSTVQNLIPDLATAILASTDWSRLTPTASQLTTSALASAGGTTLTFTSTSGPGWAIGNVIRIGAFGAADTEYRVVNGITGTTITVTALTFAHASGTNVYWGNEVLKATTTRGADMIVDLNDVSMTPSTPYWINLAAWTSHTGTVGTNKTSRWLYWRTGTGSPARTDIVHVTVSAGKEHLYFSVEGPRATEPNTESTNYGCPKNYFFASDIVPYHSSDTTPCVFVGGQMSANPTASITGNSHVGHLSKTHAGVTGWNSCRLITLGFTGNTAGSGLVAVGANVTRQTAGDGNYYLSPYVCVSDLDGFRGRLAAFFSAGMTQADDTAGSAPIPSVGAKVTYSGKTYKLLQVNRGGATGSVVCWSQFGAAYNNSGSINGSPVVAVPST